MDQANQPAGTEKSDKAPPEGGAPRLSGEAFSSLNAWGQALASKHSQVSSLVSPWVQRSLNIVSGRPAIGIIQPRTDFSGSQTQMLVQRLSRHSEASRVWQPDIGSISPATFDRFAGEIVDRHQSLGSRYLIESATEPENSSEDFPLVGGADEGRDASRNRRSASQPSAAPSLPTGVSFSDLARMTSTGAPSPAIVQRAPSPPQSGGPFMPERPPASPKPARRGRPTSRVEEITPGGKSVVTRKALETPASQTPLPAEVSSPEQAESELATEAESEPIPTDEVQPVGDDWEESQIASVEPIEADLAAEAEETVLPPAAVKPPPIAPTPAPDLPLPASPEKPIQRKQAQPSPPSSKPAEGSKPRATPSTGPARKETPPESSVKPLLRSEEASSIQRSVDVESSPHLPPAETPAQEAEPASPAETSLPLAQPKRTADSVRSSQAESKTQTPQTGQPRPQEKKISPEESASEAATSRHDETRPEVVQRHSTVEPGSVEEPSPTPSEPLLSEEDDQPVSEGAVGIEPSDEGATPSSHEHHAPEVTEDTSATSLPLVQRQVDRKDDEAQPAAEEAIVAPEVERQSPPHSDPSSDMEAVGSDIPADDAVSPVSSGEDASYSDQASPDRGSSLPDAGPLPLAQRRREPSLEAESQEPETRPPASEQPPIQTSRSDQSRSKADTPVEIEVPDLAEIPAEIPADEAASPPEQAAAEVDQPGPSSYQRGEEGPLPLAQRRPDSKSDPETGPEQRQPSPPTSEREPDDTPATSSPAVQRQSLEPDVDGPESPKPSAAEWQVGDTAATERSEATLPLAQRRFEPSMPDEDLPEEIQAADSGPLPDSVAGTEEASSPFSAAQTPFEEEPFTEPQLPFEGEPPAEPQLPLVQRQAERAVDDLEKMVLTKALSKIRLPLVDSTPSHLSGPSIQRRTFIAEEAPLVNRFRAASPSALSLVGEMDMPVGMGRVREIDGDASPGGTTAAISSPLPLAQRSMPARTEAQDSSAVSLMPADEFGQGADSQEASTVLQRALSIRELELTTTDSVPPTGPESSREAAQSGPDLNQLARKVLPIIKRLLAVERERMRSR